MVRYSPLEGPSYQRALRARLDSDGRARLGAQGFNGGHVANQDAISQWQEVKFLEEDFVVRLAGGIVATLAIVSEDSALRGN